MINGHLINHYYIIELFNDLIGKNRFPQSSSKSETHGYEKGLSLKESLVFEKGILFMDMDLFL